MASEVVKRNWISPWLGLVAEIKEKTVLAFPPVMGIQEARKKIGDADSAGTAYSRMFNMEEANVQFEIEVWLKEKGVDRPISMSLEIHSWAKGKMRELYAKQAQELATGGGTA